MQRARVGRGATETPHVGSRRNASDNAAWFLLKRRDHSLKPLDNSTVWAARTTAAPKSRGGFVFRSIREALTEAEAPADAFSAAVLRCVFARTVTDAEVFHQAVQALVKSLPERPRVGRSLR